jgi:hypothetical protein
LPSGFIWPVPGRQLLRQLPDEGAVKRLDLAKVAGRRDEQRAQAVVYQAGELCLRTSTRHCFDDVDAGRTALLAAARARIGLGSLLLEGTVLFLAPDTAIDQAWWLWTVAPWRDSLHARMEQAARGRDERALGTALREYARGAVAALTLAARSHLLLDVHPASFAVERGSVVYLHDDVAAGAAVPAAAAALLARVQEYVTYGQAVDEYLSALERELSSLSAVDVERLELARLLTSERARSSEMEAARARLLRILPAPARAVVG